MCMWILLRWPPSSGRSWIGATGPSPFRGREGRSREETARPVRLASTGPAPDKRYRSSAVRTAQGKMSRAGFRLRMGRVGDGILERGTNAAEVFDEGAQRRHGLAREPHLDAIEPGRRSLGLRPGASA